MRSFLALLLACFFLTPPLIYAQDSLSGRVVEVQTEVIKVQLASGDLVSALYPSESALPTPKVHDHVLLAPNPNLVPDTPPYVVTDFVRTRSLFWLFLLFVLATLWVTRLRGLSAFFGLAFSFYLIFKLLLPQILAGQDPILMAILTSLFIVPVTFYLSHGFSPKTHAAVMGTFLSLICTGFLALFFVKVAHLTGLASEEAGFLLAFMGESISLRGLLLAGIIIGTLGVMDDITISQASIVQQLRAANPALSPRELFVRAMRVGHDHIASMINTLVLVYTGASLPLLLLFLDSSIPFSIALNHEIIAEEIVRTLVGSLGLVLAVPLTTLLAVRFFFTHR